MKKGSMIKEAWTMKNEQGSMINDEWAMKIWTKYARQHGSSMTLEEDKYEDEAIQTFIQTEGCTDSSTEDQQSCQPPPADQHTLQLLHRTNRNIPGDTKGSFGISIHGPCFHGPRNLLTIMGRLQETVQKVGCSTELLSESNTCLADQHTLQTSSRANVYLFGDIRSSYGISTHGPYDHGWRCLLKNTKDAQELLLKVEGSAGSTAK